MPPAASTRRSRGRIGRYTLGAELGAGAMGRVLAGEDEVLGREVAIKLVREPGRAGLRRSLKREFRLASQVRHEGLVRMHELLLEGDVVALVMERVRGRRLVSCGAPATLSPGGDTPEAAPTPGGGAPLATDQIQEVFRDLALALSVVHDAGLLHLDLHPGNVLARDGGGVALLDFGLARSIQRARGSGPRGAPGYAAPELTGPSPGAAADWFAFGALLSATLCGAPRGVLEDDPSIPSAARPLAELACSLLNDDARARPARDEVLTRLGHHPPGAATGADRFGLVGRDDVLAAARELYPRATSRRAACLVLTGAAGLGKSAVLRALAAEFPGRVVAGACRDRESLPYQGLDEVADELEVDLLAATEGPDGAAGAAQRVVAALHALTASQPVLLTIDDLHNIDPDGAQLMIRVLGEGLPAGLLLVLAARPELSPPARRVLKALDVLATGQVRFVDLEPLNPSDAKTLYGRVHARGEPGPLPDWSSGVPLRVLEFARTDEPAASSMDQLVRAQLDRLAPNARDALEVLAIGRSLRPSVLVSALPPEGGQAGVRALLEADLARETGAGASARIRPSHEAAAAAVRAQLSPEAQRAVSRRLVRALGEGDDPAALADQLHAIGELSEAIGMALKAAEHAARRGAHEAEAAHLEAATDWAGQDAERAWAERRARALNRAGHSAIAAMTLERAASSEEDGWPLLLSATERYLEAGHLEEGSALAQQLAARVGLTFPNTTRAALVRSVWLTLRLRLGSHQPVSATEDPLAARRADLAFALGKGLLAVDSVRGAFFALASLREARRSGDPVRLARAQVIVGAGVMGAVGGSMGRWGIRLTELALELARQREDKDLEGLALVGLCQAHIFRGRWRDAIEAGRSGVRVLGTSTDPSAWGWNMGSMGVIRALEEVGDLMAARTWISRLRYDAERRADRYAAVTGALYAGMHRIYEGDLEEAERLANVERVEGTAPYTIQSFYADRIHTRVAMARGDLDRAAQLCAAVGEQLGRAGLLRVPIVGIDYHAMTARVALRRGGPGRARPLRTAIRYLGAQEREDARVLAGCFDALREHRSEHPDQTSRRLLEAADRYATLDMGLDADAARARAAQLRGDLDGGFAELAQRGIVSPAAWLTQHLPLPGAET